MSFLILLTPIQETGKNRMDNPAGMTLVGLSFLIFLVVIGFEIRSRATQIKHVKSDLLVNPISF